MTLESRPYPDLDARWAAWAARGAEHDRRIGRRLAYVLPIVAAVAVAVAYASCTS